MKPLFVLLITFIISLLVIYLGTGLMAFSISGKVAMSVMLLFTAYGHFVFSKGMTLMIPDFIPYKLHVVYLTGIIEIGAATGLLIPDIERLVSWLLILFFIVIIPANIKAAVNHIDYQKGNFEGRGPAYLWFRIPLQLFFISWVYFFGISI